MSTEKTYVVDRIEGELVVLIEDESGDKVNLDSWELPAVDEGTVLAVELDGNGKPKWGSATMLAQETKRRAAEANKLLENLKKRDPGGDIKI